MAAQQENHFDIVIAGGGTIGCSVALALSQDTALRIGIIEAHKMEGHAAHPGFDARSVALASHSCEFLSQAGLADIHRTGSEIKHIHVSDKGYLGQCQLHANDYHLDALGRVIELHELGNLLQQALNARPDEQLSWFTPARISHVKQHQSHVQLTLDSDQQLSAKLLIVAEGAASVTRDKLNIDTKVTPYQQTALIANVGLSQPHQGWAYERFTCGGPIALLPLNDLSQQTDKARCSLVWTMHSETVKPLAQANEKAFIRALQEAFGYRAGIFTSVGERHVFPLSLVKAASHHAHRVALVGNSSQSLHPIAGQGLNLGLRDVEALTSAIVAAKAAGADIGACRLLTSFARHRAEDQARVVAMTDGLVRVFSNDYFSTVMGRNIGLSLLQHSPWLKKRLAFQAMGQH